MAEMYPLHDGAMRSAPSQWFFGQIHSRNLVYNQCWEDPALDNAVLQIRPADRIVMITSAGCNALDYLIHAPASIHCVDMNPHQNALLELKLAAIERLQYEQFFEMFANGRIHGHRRIYENQLRSRLTSGAQSIWDRRIDYFDPLGAGLYFHGTAGFFARSLYLYLNVVRGMRHDLQQFQSIGNLAEQAAFYRTRIAPRLWSPLVRFAIRQPAVLAMLGVPQQQIEQIQENGSKTSSFVEERVDQTLTTVPLRQNYFWRVYMNGYYPPDCYPNYLKREFFQFLRKHISRIHIHTSTLTDFLRTSPDRFSIFVLLDHMDWLSATPELLEEEWRLIIGCADQAARIIYRSGSVTCDYIPEFARRRLQFQAGQTETLHSRDRVGTYASFHFAKVMQ